MAVSHDGPLLAIEGPEASFLAQLIPLLRAEQRRNGSRLAGWQEELVTKLERHGRAHRIAGALPADNCGRCGHATSGLESIVDEVSETSPTRVPTANAAGMLGVGDRQVRRMFADGELSGSKVSGNLLLDVASIHGYIERRELNR